MRNVKWRGLGFLVLVILLFAGLSYLALHKTPVTEVDNEDPSMSIALVNEDEGTIYNDEKTVLGDEFTNSMIKGEQHDWFVVSRGVAENGISRDVYDMMIVIPTDFSERSLAFHSEKPEPVALHYKINTTGHEDVRATAEKTARNILSDFNKKLVNVYFASIIGNLQDAQDSVSDIVEKDKLYTNKYMNEVNDPLSNYTDQFSMVQNYTESSRDNFHSFGDVLATFESSLDEDITVNQAFASEIDQLVNLKNEESQLTGTFSEYLEDFIQRMTSENVSNNLAGLHRQNELIHRQFQANEDQDRSIVDDSKTLQRQFSNMNESILAYKEDLDYKLEIQLKEVIEKIFEDDEIDESYTNTMRMLFDNIDNNVKQELEKLVKEIPMLSLNAIEQSELVDVRKDEIKKIAEIAQKYIDEEEIHLHDKNKDVISEEINKIKDTLIYEGTEVYDRVTLPEDIGTSNETRRLYLSIPEKFYVTNIIINGVNVSENIENGIDVSSYGESFNLSVGLRLNYGERDEFDVFSPIKWQWKVSQNDQETDASTNEKQSDIDEASYELNSFNSRANENINVFEMANHSEEEIIDEDQLNLEGPLSEGSAENDSDENKTQDKGNQEEKEKDKKKEENVPAKQDEEIEQDEGIEQDETEEIIITNHYVYKTVQSPIELNIDERMIDKSIELINPYYQLQSLIELYYGFNILEDEITGSLVENATEDSLYYLLNENEIEGLLRDYLVDKVKADVQELMEDLGTNIDSYIELLSRAGQKSGSLAEKITETRANTEVLNEEVQQLLNELSAWREASSALLESNRVVISSDGEMTTAIMSLDSSYQPLLSSSESLRDRANNNLDSANNVYESLETIDNQAEEIKSSGTNIISKGNELAENLMQNHLENADFAENFNEVLDNSRIRDRQNNDLYHFLSNPVNIKNQGIIKNDDESLSPYFLVIVLFITTMFTGYVIHSLNERRSNLEPNDKLFIANNVPISGITAGIGLVLGLTMGLISFYLLKLNQFQLYLWIGLIVLLTMMLLFLATYLLRQLNTIGMFILLTIFGLYLIVTRALGFHFEHRGFVQSIQKISPLQYAENMLSNVIIENNQVPLVMLGLLVLFTVIGFGLNLLVYKKPYEEKEMEDNRASEAN